MNTLATQIHTRLNSNLLPFHAPTGHDTDEADLQHSIENVVSMLSYFREKMLSSSGTAQTLQTLDELKNWFDDKPMISGLVFDKIEELEWQIYSRHSKPMASQADFLNSIQTMYADIVNTLDMCQHVFFMEMAIHDAVLM